jgi:hypothetical protein
MVKSRTDLQLKESINKDDLKIFYKQNIILAYLGYISKKLVKVETKYITNDVPKGVDRNLV